LGVFEYQERLSELWDIIEQSDEGDTVETLYLYDKRFHFLIDRILTLNGIQVDWVAPSDLQWLLFGYVDSDGQPQQSPLALLNEPPKPRHPRKPSVEDSESPDFIRLLALIMSLPDVGYEEAYQVATSKPMRQVLGVIDEAAWAAMGDDDRNDLRFRQHADQFRERIRANG
jgi:hypothetical protein